MIKLHKTQYEGLKYGHIKNLAKGYGGYWTYFDCHDPRTAPAQVGIQYPSRIELLVDLHRYAKQWGHYTPYTFNIADPAARLRIMDDCHTEGWAVIFMAPDELQGANVSDVENAMLEAAWACINFQKEI